MEKKNYGEYKHERDINPTIKYIAICLTCGTYFGEYPNNPINDPILGLILSQQAHDHKGMFSTPHQVELISKDDKKGTNHLNKIGCCDITVL